MYTKFLKMQLFWIQQPAVWLKNSKKKKTFDSTTNEIGTWS